LKEGALPMVDIDSANPVTIALEEIAAGKIRFELPKLGLK
jgi:DNA-directed RNA polymerase subunit K/omega